MFTFSILYVSLYLIIFVGLLILTFTQVPLYLVTQHSIPTFVIFLQRYIPVKNLFFFLIFSLTGLPPFGLFFVKFNILAFILYQTHIFFIVILFIMFFLNMLYYMQLFNFRNFKKMSYSTVTPQLITSLRQTNYSSQNRITYRTYKLTCTLVTILFFLIFSLFFINDFFLILNIL